MPSRIALPTRIQGALEYAGGGTWKLWLHTNDFHLGTFLLLRSDGSVYRTTLRADEGDDEVLIKPKED
jgi:hypothetical protein